MLPTITLKKGREKSVNRRHPWIFSGAIQKVQNVPAAGKAVEVVDYKGETLGTGYWNQSSQIQVRMLAWGAQTVDDAFWYAQIAASISRRRRNGVFEKTNAVRLIHAESDGLPGLVVDQYDDYLVIQCLTAGIDTRKHEIVAILQELLKPTGIIERSDVDVRRKEGLKRLREVRLGDTPPDEIEIMENGLRFGVNLLSGHKTGYYLDQRDNRPKTCSPHNAAGKDVLNVFSYTGGFGVYAAANGARSVINVDSSVAVLESAERNFHRNNFKRDQDEFIAADAFEYLRHLRDTNRQFDLIILDPPKFAKSQRDVQKASRGYKDLMRLGFLLLRPGGILATYSCSGLIDLKLFQQITFAAALDARREAWIEEIHTQSTDHPISITFPESFYLKGFLCRTA